MKFLTVLTFTALSFSAVAAGDLASMKSETTSHIDQRINKLQEARTCVSNATTTEGFKACKSDMKMKMQRMEDKMGDDVQKMEDDLKTDETKVKDKFNSEKNDSVEESTVE